MIITNLAGVFIPESVLAKYYIFEHKQSLNFFAARN